VADESFEKFARDLGRRVRAVRERRRLTQEDMMERGFSLRHYQRIEAGRSVTLRTLWKLGRALKVKVRDLLPAG
jgi:transcriptional regulator with XRE-family HTH domain